MSALDDIKNKDYSRQSRIERAIVDVWGKDGLEYLAQEAKAELATLRDNSAHFAEALIAESQKVVALRAELDAKTKAVDEARGVIYELLGVLPDSKHIDDCWNWAWEELNDAGQEAVIDKRKFADNWLTSHPEGKE